LLTSYYLALKKTMKLDEETYFSILIIIIMLSLAVHSVALHYFLKQKTQTIDGQLRYIKNMRNTNVNKYYGAVWNRIESDN